MDLQILHEILSGTYNGDLNIRSQAEAQLRQAMADDLFIPSCLDLISNHEVLNFVKLAALISIKNIIANNWTGLSYKAAVKQKLIEIVAATIASPTPETIQLCKNQLLPILANIVAIDSREEDSILTLASEMIRTTEFNNIYTGVFCLMEILRVFRWSSNKTRGKKLDPIIESLFPVLVNIGTSLIDCEASATLQSDLHGDLIKYIVKCFKFVTYHDLPVPLQHKETSFNWVNLQLQLINKPVHIEDSKNPWLKTKKWCFSNLANLFSKYGTPISNSLGSKDKQYLEFKKFFLNDFVPEILTLYFKIISQWRSGEFHLSPACLFHLISFLDNSIKIKTLYTRFFLNNLQELLANFVTPILLSKSVKVIEEDPLEYIHLNMDIYDIDGAELGIHDLAALGIITTLVELRQASALPVIMKFCQDNLESVDESNFEGARSKEAILRIIGSTSHILLNANNPYYESLENLLKVILIPSLFNKFSFLRLRSLEVLLKFSPVNLDDNLIFKVYQGVLINLNIYNDKVSINDVDFRSIDGHPINEDDESLLPVQAQAALTLQSFLTFDTFKQLISNDIILVMQKLLTLSKKIDLDVISGVMQEIVELYSSQLQPFGIELMKNLSDQILTIFKEEEDENKDSELVIPMDKQMIINGILNTMITILLSFENSNDLILQLEESLLPIIQIVLGNNLDDFFTEIFELIENSTFISRSISPNMWNIFNIHLTAAFKSPIVLGYTAELTPALNNYLSYGSQELIQNPSYAANMFEILKLIKDEDLNVYNELATNFNLSLKSQQYSGVLIEISISAILDQLGESVGGQYALEAFKKHLNNRKYKTNFTNLIVSGLIYDISNTLNILAKDKQLFEIIFQSWFKTLLNKKEMSRVYDLKLSTLGLLSLLTNLSIEEFTNYNLNLVFDQITNCLVHSLEFLPSAISNLEKKRSSFDQYDIDYDKEDQKLFESQFHAFDDEDDDDQDWYQQEEKLLLKEPEAAFDSSSPSGEFLSFLKLETQRLETQLENLGEKLFLDGDDDPEFFEDDDLFEDPLSNNPLDNINIFDIVKDSLTHLQEKDPSKYQALIQQMSPPQLEILKSI